MYADLPLKQAEAQERIMSMPLASLDPSDPALYASNTARFVFDRLRDESPIHQTEGGVAGRFWSVTRFEDIVKVDTNHGVFSSDWKLGGFNIVDRLPEHQLQSFMSMDPPVHDEQRRGVAPIVAPTNLVNFEKLIRERTTSVLDSLPRGETFDWVEKVSVELTTLMLATLLDFPLEKRHKLTYWSDVITSAPELGVGIVSSAEERIAEMGRMADAMVELWNERVNAPPQPDLISMLAHGPATRHMTPAEFMGNLGVLVVGGNDTTRNSMTGGLLALHENPMEWAKLRENPSLVESLVPEIVRWQTPLIHMRRTALSDTELGGHRISKGDKVVMWYLSGNRDERAIDSPNQFIIDRARPRQHLSFGFGIHRCVGNRLAEMQLRILWEEILKRFPVIEVVGEPTRVRSNIIHGFTQLPVRIPN